jgi:hypothetical protein
MVVVGAMIYCLRSKRKYELKIQSVANGHEIELSTRTERQQILSIMASPEGQRNLRALGFAQARIGGGRLQLGGNDDPHSSQGGRVFDVE